MPWPFRRKLSAEQAIVALAFIRHFQMLLAQQQLTMEIYNDAMARAAGAMAEGDELYVRGVGAVSDPEAAKSIMLPAIEEKVRIFDQIKATHRSLSPVAIPGVIETYEMMSRALAVWHARALLQQRCWEAWASDPSLDLFPQMSSLDAEEMRATAAGLAAENALIQAAGVDADSFMEINRQAFNIVRVSRLLPTLDDREFRARYMQGLMGARPRFFDS
jgi:hypothetical protein